jgi:hypothetical protein
VTARHRSPRAAGSSAGPPLPPDLRARLERARLDTLALLRALDHAPIAPPDLPHPEMQQLAALDADCAEALWALDQPVNTLDLRAMLRDTFAALDQLPDVRAQIRTRLPSAATSTVLRLEPAIQASLDPREAYNDVPGRDPHFR